MELLQPIVATANPDRFNVGSGAQEPPNHGKQDGRRAAFCNRAHNPKARTRANGQLEEFVNKEA